MFHHMERNLKMIVEILKLLLEGMEEFLNSIIELVKSTLSMLGNNCLRH